MAEKSVCQRSDCDKPGKPRKVTVPGNGKKVKLLLCDEDYAEAARAKDNPPVWLCELLTHLGLVG
jgi:hypothetical protein